MQIDNKTRKQTLLIFVFGCVVGVATVLWPFLLRNLSWELQTNGWATTAGTYSAMLNYFNGEEYFYFLDDDVGRLTSEQLGTIEVLEWAGPANDWDAKNWLMSIWLGPLSSGTSAFIRAYNDMMERKLARKAK